MKDERDYVSAVLHNALRWTLIPARWQVAAQAVDDLVVALNNGDLPAVRLSVAKLEAAGPVRALSAANPPGAEPGPTPGPLRERINELIHRLHKPLADDRPEPDDRPRPAG